MFALAVYQDMLYIGGDFIHLGNDTTRAGNIVAWDGSAFRFLAVSNSRNGVSDFVSALVVWNDLLILGGAFPGTADDLTLLNNVAAWDGNRFRGFRNPGGADTGLGGTPYALAVYRNRLYIAGYYSSLFDTIRHDTRSALDCRVRR